jgi:hypothetical protein
MNSVITWLTTTPVNDGNWQSAADRVTLAELDKALEITIQLSKIKTGHKTRIAALQRELRKKQKQEQKIQSIGECKDGRKS